MYDHREFKSGDNHTIKCRIKSGGLYDYSAEGLCHENVHIKIDEELRDEDYIELETGDWYEISGLVKSYDGTKLDIQVDSDEDIENLGPRVNDWIGIMTENVQDLSQTGGTNKGVQSFSTGSGNNSPNTVRHFSGSASPKKESLNASVKTSASVSSDSMGSTDIDGFATGGR